MNQPIILFDDLALGAFFHTADSETNTIHTHYVYRKTEEEYAATNAHLYLDAGRSNAVMYLQTLPEPVPVRFAKDEEVAMMNTLNN